MLNYKMSDLKGIDESQVAQLLQSNVENTDEMMNLWNDAARRLSVTAKTGLTDEQLTRLASMARVARLKGVGPKYADLLVTAGVRGRKSLATYTPETLVRRLGDVKAGRSLAGPLPTLVEVGAWLAQLKPAVASDTATANPV